MLIFLFAIFWKKVTDLKPKYGTTKTTIIFSIGLMGLLFMTIGIIFIISIIFSPFNGTIIGFM
ncbi:MAG: hypothetical protein ACTSYZ_02490 [Candidatus Helarchaeota archaeon]